MSVRKTKVTKLMPVETEIQQPEAASPEETELSDFLDGLGPQGVTEVKLYRILPSGKQRFIMSGPPAQFSEQYVQVTFGEGDYMVRSRLNGAWYRSKNFSVEAPPGVTPLGINGGRESELERLRIDLEAQRLRLEQQQAEMETNRREQQAQIETDRRERELRNHELQLKMFESFSNRGSETGTIAAMIEGVRSLKDLSGNGSTLSSVKEVLEIAEHLKSFGGESADGDGGWMSYLKPVLPELARSLPVLLTQFGRTVGPAAGMPAAPTAMATGLPVPPNANTQPATPTAAPAAPPPAVAPAAAGPDAAAAPTPVTEEQFRVVKQQLIAYALNMARLGRSPAVYADLAIEMVDVQGDPVSASFVQEIVKAPDFKTWFADLQKIGEPGLVTQQAWFSDFFLAVRQIIADQSEGERGQSGQSKEY